MNRFLISLCISLSIIACDTQSQAKPQQSTLLVPKKMTQNIQACKGKRPEVCIEIYQPVCGKLDPQVPCEGDPCKPAAWLEYANSCKACSNNLVSGFIHGSCKKRAIH